MSANNAGEPDWGVEGFAQDADVLARMEGVNRSDYPAAAAAAWPFLQPVKMGADGKTVEPLTDSGTETLFGICIQDKDAGLDRVTVYTQGDFVRETFQAQWPALDVDELMGGNSRITFKTQIFSGAE